MIFSKSAKYLFLHFVIDKDSADNETYIGTMPKYKTLFQTLRQVEQDAYKDEFHLNESINYRTTVVNSKDPVDVQYAQFIEDHGMNSHIVVCTSAPLFKKLSGLTKVTGVLGTPVTTFNGWTQVMYLPDASDAFYNPELYNAQSLVARVIIQILEGTWKEPTEHIKQIIQYPKTLDELKLLMGKKLSPSVHSTLLIAIDIETTGLDYSRDKIKSIAFASCPLDEDSQDDKFCVFSVPWNEEFSPYLKEWFKVQANRTHSREFPFSTQWIFHNTAFDMSFLALEVNDHDKDKALEWMSKFVNKNYQQPYVELRDTRILAYLNRNTCAGNKLGLKDLTCEYMGNYGIDVSDTEKIPLHELLEYNALDAYGTLKLFQRERQSPYAIGTYMRDSPTKMEELIPVIVSMQITGMPVDMDEVHKLNQELTLKKEELEKRIYSYAEIKETNELCRQRLLEKKNKALKKTKKTLDDIPQVVFSLASMDHLRLLLFEVLELEPVGKTQKNLPSVGMEELKKLSYQLPKKSSSREAIDDIIAWRELSKIMSSVVPALENASVENNWGYLHGHFTLGGTVSGRLSSNSPNLNL